MTDAAAKATSAWAFISQLLAQTCPKKPKAQPRVPWARPAGVSDSAGHATARTMRRSNHPPDPCCPINIAEWGRLLQNELDFCTLFAYNAFMSTPAQVAANRRNAQKS